MRRGFANHKGGPGKTFITAGTAAAFSKAGKRVLVGDLDPQANLTTAVGAIPNDQGAVAAMTEGTVEIQKTAWPGVDIIVASLGLARVEMDGSHDVPFRLDDTLKGVDLSMYDEQLWDFPPSVGRLLLAGLVMIEELNLVTDASPDGTRGISNVLQSAKLVQDRMNPHLAVGRIIINKWEGTLDQEYRQREMRTAYDDLVWKGKIPKRQAVVDSTGVAQSIFDNKSDGGKKVSTALDWLRRSMDASTIEQEVVVK